MAKQSKSQKATVERVMHAFADGDLEAGTGKKVRSRKQAIAIGLNEAGLSNQHHRNAHQRQSSDRATKAELMARARERDIPGRSKMTKKALRDALG